MSDRPVSEQAVSVAGLNQYIQSLLELDPQLRQIWVVGEVSSANDHRSGLFFTLQDPEGTASIRCVVWNSHRSRLVQVPLKGEQVMVLGSVGLYPKRGEYQLTVWQAFPGGEGLQALRYRQLRSRLEAEGLFDALRKRPLPAHPQTLAVVTSPQAAAWGDLQASLSDRYPGLQVLLSPATVQGARAPEEIARAIARVEADGRAEVLIVTRGGGASEDLACFNDERVVRAIASCSIPTISGIGHQRDETLSDEVADACAHTPTAIAELAVPEWSQLYKEHRDRLGRLSEAARRQLDREGDRLDRARSRLQRLPLDRQLRLQQRDLARQQQRLLAATRRQLDRREQHCASLRDRLASLDPHRVLQRGYALVRTPGGAIVRSPADLCPGEEVVVEFDRGRMTVKIMDLLDE
ncbi:exodeoxyribonuclease VII large subunit [Oxynema sp. CENA135]|uniref:exodeoxyribonuclease VII large subunit n=1 Tax=Oxynema sp. CENA135 TaxID=984206 RepID=UPI00190D35DE|nr:exodeoxyribonuclease VII large subunit [Oxynema sp. CENA135]MBK4731838.1 exodeoxyribonuclease VII large subunit [Oxynema sp. CENA135]